MSHDQRQARDVLTLRPSIGSYLAFCGIWVVLALSNGLLAVFRDDPGLEVAAAITGTVAAVTVAWIAGHRIRFESNVLHYRDGLFRLRSIKLEVYLVGDERTVSLRS